MATSYALAQPSKLDLIKVRDHVDKGNFYLARMNFKQALDEYEQCLRIDPSNQVARDNIVLCHNNWGIHYFKQNKYDLAKAEWEKALKLNPYDRNAKINMGILKATMAKSGADVGSADGAQEKKEESQSGVILLTPGYKQSQGSGKKDATSESDSESNAANTASVKILHPGASDTTSATSAPPEGSANNSGSNAAVNSPQVQGSPTKVKSEKAKESPANPDLPDTYSLDLQTTGAPPTPPAKLVGTVEEQLEQLEVKLYGKTHDTMPVLKRLDKLELDTGGQVSSATINQRLEALRKAYGP
jgi:tetratricopeptide (TPR) repeat protein